MGKLVPIAPLGGLEPQIDRVGGVVISEVTDRALASVSCRMGRDAGFALAIEKLCGIAAPGPGKSAAGATYTLYWTGPGQWFSEAPFASHEDIAARMKAVLGAEASVTEQSDAWARFRIEGGPVVAMMQRLCGVDSAAMAAGDVTRSMIEHLGSLVIRTKTGFEILCPRSGAGSLHHALVGAAKSVA